MIEGLRFQLPWHYTWNISMLMFLCGKAFMSFQEDTELFGLSTETVKMSCLKLKKWFIENDELTAMIV